MRLRHLTSRPQVSLGRVPLNPAQSAERLKLLEFSLRTNRRTALYTVQEVLWMAWLAVKYCKKWRAVFLTNLARRKQQRAEVLQLVQSGVPGTLEYYTLSALRLREHLRFRAGVERELQRWWVAMSEPSSLSSHGVVMQDVYQAVHAQLARALLPRDTPTETLSHMWITDWYLDSGGQGIDVEYLGKRQFIDGVFQLVDLWVNSLDEIRYIKWLRTMLRHVAHAAGLAQRRRALEEQRTPKQAGSAERTGLWKSVRKRKRVIAQFSKWQALLQGVRSSTVGAEGDDINAAQLLAAAAAEFQRVAALGRCMSAICELDAVALCRRARRQKTILQRSRSAQGRLQTSDASSFSPDPALSVQTSFTRSVGGMSDLTPINDAVPPAKHAAGRHSSYRRSMLLFKHRAKTRESPRGAGSGHQGGAGALARSPAPDKPRSAAAAARAPDLGTRRTRFVAQPPPERKRTPSQVTRTRAPRFQASRRGSTMMSAISQAAQTVERTSELLSSPARPDSAVSAGRPVSHGSGRRGSTRERARNRLEDTMSELSNRLTLARSPSPSRQAGATTPGSASGPRPGSELAQQHAYVGLAADDEGEPHMPVEIATASSQRGLPISPTPTLSTHGSTPGTPTGSMAMPRLKSASSGAYSYGSTSKPSLPSPTARRAAAQLESLEAQLESLGVASVREVGSSAGSYNGVDDDDTSSVLSTESRARRLDTGFQHWRDQDLIDELMLCLGGLDGDESSGDDDGPLTPAAAAAKHARKFGALHHKPAHAKRPNESYLDRMRRKFDQRVANAQASRSLDRNSSFSSCTSHRSTGSAAKLSRLQLLALELDRRASAREQSMQVVAGQHHSSGAGTSADELLGIWQGQRREGNAAMAEWRAMQEALAYARAQGVLPPESRAASTSSLADRPDACLPGPARRTPIPQGTAHALAVAQDSARSLQQPCTLPVTLGGHTIASIELAAPASPSAHMPPAALSPQRAGTARAQARDGRPGTPDDLAELLPQPACAPVGSSDMPLQCAAGAASLVHSPAAYSELGARAPSSLSDSVDSPDKDDHLQRQLTADSALGDRAHGGSRLAMTWDAGDASELDFSAEYDAIAAQAAATSPRSRAEALAQASARGVAALRSDPALRQRLMDARLAGGIDSMPSPGAEQQPARQEPTMYPHDQHGHAKPGSSKAGTASKQLTSLRGAQFSQRDLQLFVERYEKEFARKAAQRHMVVTNAPRVAGADDQPGSDAWWEAPSVLRGDAAMRVHISQRPHHSGAEMQASSSNAASASACPAGPGFAAPPARRDTGSAKVARAEMPVSSSSAQQAKPIQPPTDPVTERANARRAAARHQHWEQAHQAAIEEALATAAAFYEAAGAAAASQPPDGEWHAVSAHHPTAPPGAVPVQHTNTGARSHSRPAMPAQVPGLGHHAASLDAEPGTAAASSGSSHEEAKAPLRGLGRSKSHDRLASLPEYDGSSAVPGAAALPLVGTTAAGQMLRSPPSSSHHKGTDVLYSLPARQVMEKHMDELWAALYRQDLDMLGAVLPPAASRRAAEKPGASSSSAHSPPWLTELLAALEREGAQLARQRRAVQPQAILVGAGVSSHVASLVAALSQLSGPARGTDSGGLGMQQGGPRMTSDSGTLPPGTVGQLRELLLAAQHMSHPMDLHSSQGADNQALVLPYTRWLSKLLAGTGMAVDDTPLVIVGRKMLEKRLARLGLTARSSGSSDLNVTALIRAARARGVAQHQHQLLMEGQAAWQASLRASASEKAWAIAQWLHGSGALRSSLATQGYEASLQPANPAVKSEAYLVEQRTLMPEKSRRPGATVPAGASELMAIKGTGLHAPFRRSSALQAASRSSLALCAPRSVEQATPTSTASGAPGMHITSLTARARQARLFAMAPAVSDSDLSTIATEVRGLARSMLPPAPVSAGMLHIPSSAARGSVLSLLRHNSVSTASLSALREQQNQAALAHMAQRRS